MSDKTNSIAGMSLGGGKKENFFFCLLEFFEKDNRWFLTSLKQVKEESNLSKDQVITEWVESSSLKKLIVDFPLSKPPCETCDLKCPGEPNCHHPVVVDVRNQIKQLLAEDRKLEKENPKRYEQEREEDNKVHYQKSVLEKETAHHILSKSFKRKLKKGFIPYWNRPVDYWVWKNYYDQLLKTFDLSYDSFGNVSVMLLYKFHYLLRHLPNDLGIYESSVFITLLELYRSEVISKKQILELQDINLNTLARVQVAKAIEKKLGIFIYKNDLELIAKNPKAFDSFILAVAGQSLILGKNREIPKFGAKDMSNFVAPTF
ncbi:MAG: hypothetical protein CME62_17560 [Halobacteriovoraceae bacterium]|nr:hypothetical protein [Halobacteriovoraceae bacterium]|tara:strand:+ start:30949 stop:31899 length:951 start_codon:yes stop_codon:yes gene_type:complete